MIYLASPYTHKNFAIMEDRYIITRDVTAKLLKRGEHIYSPIVHCHELAKFNDMPRDITFWKQYNLHMLALAEELYVLTLNDWKKSAGIATELHEAYVRNIITWLIDPHTLELEPYAYSE